MKINLQCGVSYGFLFTSFFMLLISKYHNKDFVALLNEKQKEEFDKVLYEKKKFLQYQ